MSQIDDKKVQGIKVIDEIARGQFSNNMLIAHGSEEFIIDWILDSPTGAQLVSRIIVTPGHMKRIVDVFLNNLKMYEEKYGPTMSQEPVGSQFKS